MLALYTAVGTKLSWYAMPFYPATSLLIAHLGVEACRTRAARRPIAGAGPVAEARALELRAFALAGLAVATLALVLAAPLGLVRSFGVAGALATAAAIMLRRERAAQVAGVAALALFTATPIASAGYFYAGGESAPARLARAGRSPGASDREPMIVYKGVSWPTPVFYSDRPAVVADSMPMVDDSLPRVGTRRLLVLDTDLAMFQARYDVHVVGTAPPLVSALIARPAGPDR
jgi:hypothetical protein